MRIEVKVKGITSQADVLYDEDNYRWVVRAGFTLLSGENSIECGIAEVIARASDYETAVSSFTAKLDHYLSNPNMPPEDPDEISKPSYCTKI